MASTPIYEASLTFDVAHRATANAGDYTGTTTADLATGTANGKYVEELSCAIRGTSTQNAIRFFVTDGSTKIFIFEVPIPARTVTPGANAAFSWAGKVYIPLPTTNHKIQFNTETNDSIDVFAKGKAY